MTASLLVGRALAQVMTSVSDLPRAIGFYRDVLGLPFLFETNGMVFFQLAGARLMIGSHPAIRPRRAARASISTPRTCRNWPRRWRRGA